MAKAPRPAKRCTARNGPRHPRPGEPCGHYAVEGADVCTKHGGSAPQVRARAAVRHEVLHRWRLGDAHADPGEVLLRLVTQSANRCEHYAQLLEDAYDAAEQLRTAHEAGDLLIAAEPSNDDAEPAAVQTARADLDRIFTTGGVAALVGHTYADTKTGDIYATGEAIRGLAKLEADERDRCADFAAKAVRAGLAERQVRLAERQGALLAELMRAVMNDPELGLTDTQRRAMPHVARRHLSIASSITG